VDTPKKEVAIMEYGYEMLEEWFGGGIFMLLFLGVVIIGGFSLARMLLRNPSNIDAQTTEPTELEILKERYVRGDISHAELEKIKTNILEDNEDDSSSISNVGKSDG
ncbi:MAG TPA: hypothetical protein VN631_15335, partial [Negativicutes bacterium]|nr:hypothetical protein [Negativicutes bacterium]